jgi:hypothetical protein
MTFRRSAPLRNHPLKPIKDPKEQVQGSACGSNRYINRNARSNSCLFFRPSTLSEITPAQIRHQLLLPLPINMLLRTSVLLQLVGALITTQGKSAPYALLVRSFTPQYVTRCLNQPTS